MIRYCDAVPLGVEEVHIPKTNRRWTHFEAWYREYQPTRQDVDYGRISGKCEIHGCIRQHIYKDVVCAIEILEPQRTEKRRKTRRPCCRQRGSRTNLGFHSERVKLHATDEWSKINR